MLLRIIFPSFPWEVSEVTQDELAQVVLEVSSESKPERLAQELWFWNSWR